MAIVDNGATEVGDEIFMEATLPITGVVSFDDWVDDTENETGSEFFEKDFAYTLDGVNWTDYMPLSTANVQAIPVQSNYDVMFRFRYTRAGVSGSNVIVNWVKITTDDIIEKECGIAFSNSVFSYFWDCHCSNNVLSWCQNVLEKMYRPGIVPQYITRGTNNNANQEDRDYIDFWRAISCYWALLVAYAREFERFHHHQELLVKYLRQRGMFVCDNTPMEDLRYLMENFYDEMRKRGTLYVGTKKGETPHKYGIRKFGFLGPSSLASVNQVNGELLRLICYKDICDEFIFAPVEFDRFGWVVDKWSPMWRGTTNSVQMNKAYEKSDAIQSRDNYPTFGPGSIFTADDGSGLVMVIDNVPAGQIAGIGTDGGEWDEDAAINVDPNLAYEISFWMRAAPPTFGNQVISFGAYCFTATGTPVPLQRISDGGFPDTNMFFEEQQIIQFNEWYFVRGIIYPNGTPIPTDPRARYPEYWSDWTSFDAGNMRFTSDEGCKLIPYVVVDNSSGGGSSDNVNFRNFRVSLVNTPYSTGFIERADFVQIWMKYNSGEYTEEKLKEIISFYLLPYKAVLQANFI